MPGNTRRDSLSEQTRPSWPAAVAQARGFGHQEFLVEAGVVRGQRIGADELEQLRHHLARRRRLSTISWVMPVSEVMKDGMRAPQFTSET
jgi:hypothetical protein